MTDERRCAGPWSLPVALVCPDLVSPEVLESERLLAQREYAAIRSKAQGEVLQVDTIPLEEPDFVDAPLSPVLVDLSSGGLVNTMDVDEEPWIFVFKPSGSPPNPPQPSLSGSVREKDAEAEAPQPQVKAKILPIGRPKRRDEFDIPQVTNLPRWACVSPWFPKWRGRSADGAAVAQEIEGALNLSADDVPRFLALSERLLHRFGFSPATWYLEVRLWAKLFAATNYHARWDESLLADFHAQEILRFSSPAEAFTYRAKLPLLLALSSSHSLRVGRCWSV